MDSKYPDLSPEELNELKETFRLFDKDGDGAISEAELSQALQILGLHPTASELSILLASVDTDQNGVIELDEFIDLMRNHLHRDGPTAAEELREAFKVFDANGDGLIEEDELRSALLNLGEKLDDDELREMIKTADKDGNGKIDYEEFLELMKTL